MTRSIWMGPWDLEGREADAVLDELQGIGLTAASLAMSYHGGRMLLPRHRSRLVYELHPGAAYFEPDGRHYEGLRLQPAVSPLAPLTLKFLDAAARRNFPVSAWTVLCHNDFLGVQQPDCCIENVFGDRYTYALCPSHPDVQAYILALCADIARIPGVACLDVEALSFMGYEHQSLHDKRGITLDRESISMLSLCFCEHCRANMGADAEAVRQGVRKAIQTGMVADGNAVIQARRRVLVALLARLRHATKPAPINLRISTDPEFHGGKTALSFVDAAPFVDAATVTYFGASFEHMAEQIKTLIPSDIPLHGGIVFHNPDCISERDLLKRLALLEGAAFAGTSFYSYSMAAKSQIEWLRNALKGPRNL